MTGRWLVLVESNTTGTGRLFAARAREQGLRPLLLARDPDRYPYAAADGLATRRVDTGDPAELRRAVADLAGAVAGVASSSEYYIAAAARLARSLDLPHPDPAAVEACRDKAVQRARLAEAGVAGARFATADTPDEAAAAAGRIGLPVVVKPIAGSGSIATRRCDRTAEVPAAALAVLEAGLARPAGRPAVLVEQYLAGPEFSVETFDGEVVGVTAKHLGPEPYFVEIGHDFPEADEAGRIGAVAVRALRALGLGWGAAHVEIRVGADGPHVVEVNPRLAGGLIPRLVEVATGLDLVDLVVAAATGPAPAPRPTRRAGAAIRFVVAPATGRLVEVAGLAAARARPGVVEAAVSVPAGAVIEVRHAFTDRIGHVIAAGPDAPAAGARAEAARQEITVQMDALDPMAVT